MEKKSPASGNRLFLFTLVLGLTAASAFTFRAGRLSAAEEESIEPVRKSAVADSFYPANKEVLDNFLTALLQQANPPPLTGAIRAIIVPHAGYLYSGPVAAYAYKAIQGQPIKTVVLLSNSHRHYFEGIAVYGKGSFETPLGLVPVDREFTEKLLRISPLIQVRPDVHQLDHVLEVQLPFLQRTLKNFKIVPILFGTDAPEYSAVLADALKKTGDDKTLIVASTDMSHYPSYPDANAADSETLRAILTGKVEELDRTLAELRKKNIPQAETFLCGVSGVRTAMLVARAEGATEIKLLNRANSGDTSGDKRRVVGYSAIAFIAENSKPSPQDPAAAKAEAVPPKEELLNAQEQEDLLKLARLTVETYVRTKAIPPYSPTSPKLELPTGAFVTLRKHGELRGCIGRFEPNTPLFIVIQQMAIAAATQDPRFPPVKPQELDKLDYEISVLSPLRNIGSADEIELGKHGVQVTRGFHSGVFLPQVATETGWSKEEFLSELCSQKAGLEPDCWKSPRTQLQVFTAQVFPEEKK